MTVNTTDSPKLPYYGHEHLVSPAPLHLRHAPFSFNSFAGYDDFPNSLHLHNRLRLLRLDVYHR
jgi:hypothetical protein